MNHEYDDPSRNSDGQFHYHVGANATSGEQSLAGVNRDDGYLTAQIKTEQYRQSQGLDPQTGLVRPVPFDRSGGYGPYTPSRPDGASTGPGMLAALGRLIKVAILWPAAIAIALGAIAAGLLMLSKSLDGATLTARAAKNEFGYYQPVPLTSRFTAKELAFPVTPASILATWKSFSAKEATVPQKQSLAGYAYRCMLQEGCRGSLMKLDARLGAELPMLAAGFLIPLVKNGDQSAARDLCLFTINVGISYKDMLTARYLCSRAQNLNPTSESSVKALSQLEGSWAMRRALIYFYIDQAAATFERQGISGLAYFMYTHSPFTYSLLWAVPWAGK